MIHAYYCYDSDPIDQWFWEDIEIVDLAYWHLTKYFEPDQISFKDDHKWDLDKHYGGMLLTFGGPLNEPKWSVLNQPAEWEHDPDDALDVEDYIDIKLIDANGKILKHINDHPAKTP